MIATAQNIEIPSDEHIRLAMDLLAARLVAAMHPEGYWEGWLSSSALATATAISALALARSPDDAARIHQGVAWLVVHQNADGGWGDTIDSPSNLATTLLTLSALRLARHAYEAPQETIDCATAYLVSRKADTPAVVVEAVQNEYGADRTFASPILMNCALAELAPWDAIPSLPFELAGLPQSWYKAVRLHVVSYALPALIAIGLLVDRKNPGGMARRWIRKLMTPRVLKKLAGIQPRNGGFLEATPLTSFVAMALLPLYGREQPVAAKCLNFLRQSQRTGGAWPIDTNLSVWLTTSALGAFVDANRLSLIDADRTARWIAGQQYRQPHPYTGAEPGGWAWTHLDGGVPDVDDTAGAIIALSRLGHTDGFEAGIGWLLNLQNSDGGWPTFCRGWGQLPFDRSSPDLTAHALRAIHAARAVIDSPGCRQALHRGLEYLHVSQRADGAWIPLWFGNQAAPDMLNPVLGTSRVVQSLAVLEPEGACTHRGVAFLVASQNGDGGWGGASGVASSIEETVMAVTALTCVVETAEVRLALARACEYLMHRIPEVPLRTAPIGLYFSHLWYSEELYPLIWALSALGLVLHRGRS